MVRLKNVILLLFAGFLLTSSCSTKRNTFVSRQYHTFTTYFNVYFNGKESFKKGEKKIAENYKENYTCLLPVFISDNEIALKTAYSDMDRAVTKGKKAIKIHSITVKPKNKKNASYKYYKKQRSKKEYNRFIDDCYMLVAKGSFYNKKYDEADKIFDFIICNFEGEPIVLEARLWYARSLANQGKFTRAKKQLFNVSNMIDLIPSYLKEMYYKVSLDINIKSGNTSCAISSVEKLVNITSGSKDRLRYKYILAQLQLNAGNDDIALSHFRNIAKKKTVSYDMAFNASISMAMAYKGINGEEFRSMLNKMLREERNVRNKDKIYYALGYMEGKDGNIEQSAEYVRKSLEYSIGNDVQKSKSYKYLGDYYYKKKDYLNAYRCYDYCVYLRGGLFHVERELLIRKKKLWELIENINEIKKQDSLQALASMSPRQRNKIIQKKIDKKKEEVLNQYNVKPQDEDDLYLGKGNSNAYKKMKGKWYFYNPVAVSIGRSEFARKWGKRRREDNWRRGNRTIADINNMVKNEDVLENISLDINRYTKEYYLNNIPLSQEKLKLSDSIIVESVYSVAYLLDESIDDNEEALKYYEKLIERYPQNKYLIYAYFNAYKILGELKDYSKQEYYKSRILEEFPESRYASLIKSTDYMQKHKSDIETVDALYVKAYREFTNFSFENAINLLDKALDVYSDNDLLDRILLLKALCIGKLYSKSDFIGALKKVLAVNPEKEIREMAERLIYSMTEDIQ